METVRDATERIGSAMECRTVQDTTVLRRQQGFTIVEFMVAVGLLGILMLAVSGSVTSQQRTYVVVDQVAEVKQNVRVVADLIEREIRNAGFMVPTHGAVCGVDAVNTADKLYVSDHSQIVALNAVPATSLTRPLGAVVQGVGAGGLGSGSQGLSLDTLDIDGVGGGSDFSVGAGVIVADRNGAFTGVACGTVTAIGPNPDQIQVDLENATGVIGPGAELVAIPALVYELVGNTLRRNGVTLVSQVDDLQVAYFFDLNGNDLVDANELRADGVGGVDDYDPQALDASQLREVRINLVLRTRDPDPNQTWQQGIGQVTENRTPGSVPGSDGVRRRVHTSTVRLRNVVS